MAFTISNRNFVHGYLENCGSPSENRDFCFIHDLYLPTKRNCIIGGVVKRPVYMCYIRIYNNRATRKGYGHYDRGSSSGLYQQSSPLNPTSVLHIPLVIRLSVTWSVRFARPPICNFCIPNRFSESIL